MLAIGVGLVCPETCLVLRDTGRAPAMRATPSSLLQVEKCFLYLLQDPAQSVTSAVKLSPNPPRRIGMCLLAATLSYLYREHCFHSFPRLSFRGRYALGTVWVSDHRAL